MTNTETWSATSKLAKRWRTSRVVQMFRAELPQNIRNGEPLECMSNLTRNGYADSHPVQVYRAIPEMGIPIDARIQTFLAASNRVDRGVSMLTAWVRSRLPGYPHLKAPQLASGTYYTMQDNSFDVPWFPEMVAAGLENDPAPRQINTELGIRGHAPARELAAAIRTTISWQAFAAAATKLNSDSTSELVAAQTRLSERLTQDRLADIEHDDPRLLLKRRKALTDSVIDDLSGSAADYARSFNQVNEEINLVVTHIFSQLLAFGLPRRMGGTDRLELLPGRPARVTFHTSDLLRVGRLYWSDDPLVTDAIHVDTVTFGDSAVHGITYSCSGTILHGSASAWRSTI
ncbi:hypothetical protein [Nocardia sp. 348MFTsu5.1]|uniref:hypothetical protein n=1 Tax=Nocardia sp. 348MFTsu5.1 TaxID=1172185 RepID=UPI0012DBFFF8|nr:hypothetical protein [Nocardia sp. 348MFTsu5.1]